MCLQLLFDWIKMCLTFDFGKTYKTISEFNFKQFNQAIIIIVRKQMD